MAGAYDAVVIGSGPNGLAAAIVLAQAGRRVLVLERAEKIGGGTRSEALTLPGFVHDVCSAAHPMGVASPFFNQLPLAAHGLEWVQPPLPLAHPLDDGLATAVHTSVDATADGLGPDRAAYLRLMKPLVESWPDIKETLLSPIGIPHRAFSKLVRFGWSACGSAWSIARRRFRHDAARALLAGHAAHSVLPLDEFASGAFGLVLAITAHAVGWPIARGGSQKIAESLAAYFRSLGGELRTGETVEQLDQLPSARAVLADVSPRQLLRIAGNKLSPGYQRQLERFRYGPGVFKLDWALNGPIPWLASVCRQAGTVHVGGTIKEIARSERAVWEGTPVERPFVILTQPSLFDASRAPAGKHTAWAYCHVPNGFTADMTRQVEAQVERFAPGFRDLIAARHTLGPADFERHNPNMVGGDLGGGANHLMQIVARPTRRLYRTSLRGLYLCSASTPPGGGVHGMCGYFAARAALADNP